MAKKRKDTRKEKIHYVYVHYDRMGHCFYCGKGKKDRAWSTASRNSDWWEKVLKDDIVHFEVEIIAQDMTDAEALIYESAYIESYGLDQLTNIRK